MPSTIATQPRTAWWERDRLGFDGDRLRFGGHDVERLAASHGTPTFFYDARRVQQNLQRLCEATARVGLGSEFRVLYAMKANRFAPLLTYLRLLNQVGIDACSPNEVEHAIACGFAPEQISLTAHSLSPGEFERLARFPGIRINLDSVSAISSWGALRPSSEIGIRINPGVGVSRASNDRLAYAGALTTKFGVYREQFGDAVAVARKHDLTISTIHFHTGCGYLTEQLEAWDEVIGEASWFVDQLPEVHTVNVGGGLGVPHTAADRALDLDAWASVLAKRFGGTHLTIQVEPGDFLLKDAGILLATVCFVERKRDRTFVGLNAGFNLAVEPVVYQLPFEPVPVVMRPGPQSVVTVVGNINEAMDIWYENIQLPAVEIGDTLALLNAGAYSSSMASNHCMRGEFKEFLLV